MPNFTCNFSQAGKPFGHFWEHTVGSGHASLALRADWQSQLLLCHNELGFEHVRFHALLSEEMETLLCEEEKLLYSFFNADQIMDFLLSIGMRPFVELSFMPRALASGDTTVFRYGANVTPPKDYEKWATLIGKLTAHWVERYGVNEVREWFFEAWNEPNLKTFWTGTQQDYFKLYRSTVEAVKSVDPLLKVGGPATAKNAWISEFLDFCEKNKVPVDFITTHHYPTDAFGKIGADTEAALDTLGRAANSYLVNNPDGATTASTFYDSNGRVQTVSAPYRTTLTASDTTAYDGLNRPTSLAHLDGTSSYAYYGALVTGTGVNSTQLCSSGTYGIGYPTLTVDEAGKRREFWSDGFGRLIETDEPDSSGALTLATCNKYNLANNLVEVDQGAQTRTYTYDLVGRALSASIPETTATGGSQQTSYSHFDSDSTCGTSVPGQLVATLDARGVRTCLQYDALGRVTQKSYNVGSTGVPATATVNYYYDSGGSSANALGRLTSMTDGVGSETYTFDAGGRVTQLAKVVGSTTYTTSYAYNLGGEPTSITYPSGRVVYSAYDAIGRLCVVGGGSNSCSSNPTPYATMPTSNAYNAAGQLLKFTYGNNVVANFGYSSNRLQMTSLAYTNASSTLLLGLNYYYAQDSTNCPSGVTGNNGQIQCINDVTGSTGASGRSVAYSYDELSRLSTAPTAGSSSYPQWGLSWTYDRYGNRTAQTVTAGSGYSGSLIVNANTNQITETGYSYDANGNMLNDGVNTMTYDAENRILTSSNGSASGAYVYDGNGLRVKKCIPNCSSPTTTTVYLFSGSKVIAEYDNGAAYTAPTREYLFAGGLKVATVDTAVKYHLRDHLSVRVNTDTSGNIIGEQGHYPFGDSWYLNSTTSKEQFTTYERDPESGNDYAMARYNVNRLGRFSSVDPLSGSIGNPQSLNHYAYALNDPINLADPTGMTADMQAIGESGQKCNLDGITVDCGWIFNGPGGDPGEGFAQCQTSTCGGFGRDANGNSYIFYEDYVEGEGYADHTAFEYIGLTDAQVEALGLCDGCMGYGFGLSFSPQGGQGGGGGGGAFDVKKFVCNAAAIQVMNELFQAAGDGRVRSEAAISILQTGDNFNFSKMTVSNQVDASFPFPTGWSATIHTHPNGFDPWPSPQDIKSSGPSPNGVNVPFLTLSSSGLYMTDPTQKSGWTQVLPGMSWQNNRHCK